jgi:hypothetical protein
MLRLWRIVNLSGLLILVCAPSAVLAQRQTTTPQAGEAVRRVGEAQNQRPPLFFRETWKPPQAAKGMSCAECDPAIQKLVTNEFLDDPNLEVKVYGPGAKDLVVTQRAQPKDDPTFIYSGITTANWLVMLRHKTNNVDLSSPVAKIKWRTWMNGFNQLRLVIKLADGTYLVSDKTEAESADWRETEIPIADIHWRILEPDTVTLAPGSPWKEHPDLKQVEEIGFTDMMRSRRYSGGMTRFDYLEVYGFPVARTPAAKK